jgi:hypothetical protein
MKALILTLVNLPILGFYGLPKAKKYVNIKNLRVLTLEIPSIGSAKEDIVSQTTQKVEVTAVTPNLKSYRCKIGDSVVLSYPPS